MNQFLALVRKSTLLRLTAYGAAFALVFVATPEVAHAASVGGAFADLTGGISFLGDGAAKAIAMASVYITIFSVFIATLFAILLGNLMDSTYVLGSGMGDTLHLMWTVVRNFVNIGFILILLVMAVMVILGIGQEGGTGMLKKVLPKFVLALVLVNFTFFGARVLLTVSDVMSTAIFALPSAVPIRTDALVKTFCKKDTKDLTTCMENTLNLIKAKGLPGTSGKKEGKIAKTMQSSFTEVDKVIYENMQNSRSINFIRKGFDKQNGAFAILMHMMSMTNLLEAQVVGGESAGDLVVNGIMSIVISVATAVVIFALALGMIVRVVVLWITIAISPVVVLGWILKEMFQFDASSDFDPMKEFLANAFLPVFVAIPLSVGFLMILTGNALDVSVSNQGITSNLAKTKEFNTIIWWIGSLLVIWYGTFAAAKKSTIVSKVTDTIQQKAQGIFGAAGGALEHVPIMPLGGKSLSSFINTPRIMASKIQGAAQERQNQMANAGLSILPESWYKVQKSADTMTTEMRSTANQMRDAKPGEDVSKIYKAQLKTWSGQYGTWTAAEGTKVDGAYLASFKKLLRSGRENELNPNKTYTLAQVLNIVKDNSNPAVKNDTRNAINLMKGNEPTAEAAAPAAPDVGATGFTGNALYDSATAEVGELQAAAAVKIYTMKGKSDDASQAIVVDVQAGNKVIGTVEEVKKAIAKAINDASRINDESEVAPFVTELQRLTAGFAAMRDGEAEKTVKSILASISTDQKDKFKNLIDSNDEWNNWIK